MHLAKELGKFLWEIEEEMPPVELLLWGAYFELEAKESKQRAKSRKR